MLIIHAQQPRAVRGQALVEDLPVPFGDHEALQQGAFDALSVTSASTSTSTIASTITMIVSVTFIMFAITYLLIVISLFVFSFVNLITFTSRAPSTP